MINKISDCVKINKVFSFIKTKKMLKSNKNNVKRDHLNI